MAIQPYQPPSAFAKAIGSVGDDTTRIGMQREIMAHQERQTRIKDEAARDIAEARINAAMAQLERRLVGSVGGGTRGTRRSGGTGPGGAEPLSDEQIAALAGITVPDMQAGREYHNRGAQFEETEVADEVGIHKVKNETERSRTGAKNAGAYRKGVLQSMIDPGELDDFEKGRSEEEWRSRATAPDADLADVTARKRASEGKERFDIKDGTRINPVSGEMKTTEVGAARAEERRADADKDRRTDPNIRGGGPRAPREREAADQAKRLKEALTAQNTSVANAQRALDNARKDAREARSTKRAAAEEVVTKRERALATAERRLSELQIAHNRVLANDPLDKETLSNLLQSPVEPGPAAAAAEPAPTPSNTRPRLRFDANGNPIK